MHALEWTERQKSRIEGLRSKLLLWRSSPQWMRDDPENIHMLLFQFVGNGCPLALCNVSKLATQKFVVLVPDQFGFAPWSVLLNRTASFVSPVHTHLTTLPSQGGQLRTGKSDVYQLPSSRCCVVLPSVPCPITSPSAGRARRSTSTQTKRYWTLPESCGSLSSRAGPGVARFVSLANFARRSHRPPTRVGCPTHERGCLLASATSSVGSFTVRKGRQSIRRFFVAVRQHG